MKCVRYFAAIVSLLLAACGDSRVAGGPCPAGKVCLHYGNLNEPGSLDPQALAGRWEARILGDLLVGLTQDDIRGQPIPGIAESWETSADGLTWTFHLRAARWSDGAPVVAGDFVYAMRRLLDPSTGATYASLLYFIKNAAAVNDGKLPVTALGAVAIDDRTLELALEHPLPHLPELAKHPTMLPLPQHVVERWGDAWSQPQHFVANGAYQLAEWRIGDRVRATKNPHYWDADQVCIDEVSYYPTSDAISAERRVLSGELDINADFQSNRADHLRRTMPEYVHANTFLSTVYLVFNFEVPQLRDRRVRQALALAIDNEFIASKLLRAGQRPADALVPPGISSYPTPARASWAGLPFELRQQQARELLAAAGYTPERPLQIEIKHRNSPDPMLFLPAIQADWREVGVHVTLAQNETQVAYAAYAAGDFQIADASWVADYNDPMSFLYLLRSSTGQNYGRYRDDEYDRLLALADAEQDTQRRAEYLRQAEQRMLDDVAIAPVYFSVSRALVNPRVTGWVGNVGDWHRVRYLCFTNARQEN